MTLRLEKLPNKTLVRISIAIEPDLAAALTDYAAIYQQTYGEEEKPEALVPAMLHQFLGSDAGFKRARRAFHAKTGD
jgi:hypothetical protein